MKRGRPDSAAQAFHQRCKAGAIFFRESGKFQAQTSSRKNMTNDRVGPNAAFADEKVELGGAAGGDARFGSL